MTDKNNNHYRTALALNNIGISLAQRKCYWMALEVLGSADDLLAQGAPNDNQEMKDQRGHLSSQRLLTVANQYLATWKTYATDHSLRNNLKILNDTEVVDTILRHELPGDMLQPRMPLNCYLVQFTETYADSSLAHVTLRFNVANLLLALNIDHNEVVQQKAHTLLSLAFIQLNAIVYGIEIKDENQVMTLQLRSLLVLTLRCMVFSANDTELSNAYNSALSEEFFEFQETDNSVADASCVTPASLSTHSTTTHSSAPAA